MSPNDGLANEIHHEELEATMSELLAKVYDCWYAVVCCMCHKTLELKATEEEHMKMQTSHTYCEACYKVMNDQIENM